MLGQRRDMKTVFLGSESKRLASYKEEMKKIHNCIICGNGITESGSYGELGYIVKRDELLVEPNKEEKQVGWYYEFTKLCPNCFGEVNALLRRIRKESRKEEKDAKN